ncbi:MAG: DUF1573 domain-containing protein [Bacteroidia bacterium]
MKQILFSFVCLFAFSTNTYAQIDTPKPALNLQTGVAAESAKFKWETNTNHEFGKIPQDVPATVTFEFTNDSETDLIIASVKPSCGCTTPDYSKEPIKPHKKGFIKATYNAHAAGQFQKSITVTANTAEATSVLFIKGEVVPKPADTTPVPVTDKKQ